MLHRYFYYYLSPYLDKETRQYRMQYFAKSFLLVEQESEHIVSSSHWDGGVYHSQKHEHFMEITIKARRIPCAIFLRYCTDQEGLNWYYGKSRGYVHTRMGTFQ